MLDRIHGHVGATLQCELPGPHPGAEDDLFGGNFALCSGNPDRATVLAQNARDAHAGHDGRAA